MLHYRPEGGGRTIGPLKAPATLGVPYSQPHNSNLHLLSHDFLFYVTSSPLSKTPVVGLRATLTQGGFSVVVVVVFAFFVLFCF